MLLIEEKLAMLSIMLHAAAATTATCFALRPRGAQGQARSAQLRAGQRAQAAAAFLPAPWAIHDGTEEEEKYT